MSQLKILAKIKKMQKNAVMFELLPVLIAHIFYKFLAHMDTM